MKKYLLLFLLTFSTHAFGDLPWLKAKKFKIVNEQGKQVVLRGVNLGSWLVEEMWMLPIKTNPPKKSTYRKIKDHVSLWHTLQNRFGQEKMEEIRTAYRNTWITEDDFRRIREMGFTCVRLPFLADLQDEPKGLFFWLDHACDMAKKHNLYIILDLHGAPGRQSETHHTGEAEQNRFFSEPPNWDKAAKLWAEIAKRYKDRSEIAGYDLLNEPKGASSNRLLYDVQNKLYKAIRKHDTRHLIFIEDGYKGIQFMPRSSSFGWKNCVLSTHIYTYEKLSDGAFLDALDKRFRNITKIYTGHKMPYFLGEFNVKPYGDKALLKAFLARLKKNKISYCFWSYKIAHRYGGHELWGLYSADRHVPTIDPFSDRYEKILKKIRALRTEKLQKNKEAISLF